MLTDLVQIARLGEKSREENERFRKHLKRHGAMERRFRRIAQEVHDSIDCMACANCCRVATARLISRDIEKLSKHLGLSPAHFLAQHTVQSPEEGLILRRTERGCVFLEGTSCTVYDARPESCRNFPHLLKGSGSVTARMWDFKDRACYCPIVYNALELLKRETKFR